MAVNRNRTFSISDKRRALLETLLQKEGVEVLRPDRIPKHDPNEPLRLSFAQERLWLINKLAPSSTAYNIATAIRLTGELDKAALTQSLIEVVRRHESLRTTFALDDEGRPIQVIAPPDVAFKMIERDLGNLPEIEKEPEAKRLACITAREPFDLSQGPLLRAELLRLSDDDHVFVVAMHHIVSDAWSVDLFVNEITTLYEAYSHGRTSPLPELMVQYADFAQWQRNKITSEVLNEQLAYWKERLAGAPGVLAMPTDRPRPLIETHQGAIEDFELPASLLEGVRELSKQENATLFMTLLAAFQTLLSRYSGLKDIVVGTPIANRGKAELENLIGFFVNTLVIRTEFHDGENFRELLQRVRETALAAYAHQDVPFEKLVEELQPQRNLSHQPIFQTLFTVQNVGDRSGSIAFRGLRLKSLDFDSGTAAVDLAWIVEEQPNRFVIRVQYSTDLFERATIKRMIDNFETLLSGIVSNPQQDLSKQPLLTEAERRELLVEWNDTKTPYAYELSASQLFEYHAAEAPTAIAVSCGNEQLTYGELNERANQLAHYLTSLGVGPEVLVGVCLDRSIEMIVALLGVLKAGGAYVPLDPSYPLERLALMLDDSQAPVLLTEERLADALPAFSSQVICLDSDWDLIARQSVENPAALVNAENLAYVVYTSGSTGTPKGVMVQHGSLLNLINWHQQAYGVTASDRCTQLAGPSFDATVWELWPALCAGASVHLPGEETRLFSSELVQWLAEKQITISFLPTPLAEALLAEQWPAGMALRWLLTGGDKLHRPPPPGLGVALVNHYGPTENTVVSTSVEVPPSEDVTTAPPIGRPISNVDAYIVDEQLEPVPIGVAGEVLVGGAGLARGYWRQAELTAEKFVPHPFSRESGARLYRTGDLGRYLANGQIEFLGRVDQQVKVRGYRIEPGDIETALAQHPAVRECVVLAREDMPGEKRLVAYIVPDEQHVHADLDLHLYTLPNNLEIAHINKNETDYVYNEIFDDLIYVKNGIELNDGDCVFDVGANIGLFTLFLHHRYRNLKVYAFEPLPPTFAVLRSNVALYNLPVRLFNCGLSHQSDTASFTFYPRMSVMSGRYADAAEEEQTTRRYMNSRDEELGRYADEILVGRYETEEYECQLRRLSDVLREEQIECVDLLKVDVEKSEQDVLDGIDEDDWKKIKQLIVEVHDRNGRLAAIREMLHRRGYEVWVEQEKSLEATGLYNVYAVRAEKKQQGRREEAGETGLQRSRITASDLRRYLREKLPEYMVPAAYVKLDALPLTANGKVDRRALPAPEQNRGELKAEYEAPRNEVEQQLAQIWSEVLKVERVGINDNFFELGGDSILSIQIVARAGQAGLQLTPRQLFQHQTIAALSVEVKTADGELAAEQGTVSGAVALTPIQHWFFEQEVAQREHYNQAVLLRVPRETKAELLQAVVEQLVVHHDALRLRFEYVNGKWQQSNAAVETAAVFSRRDVSRAELERLATEAQQSLNLSAGPLVRAVLFDLGGGEQRLLLVVHHLAVDGVSWRILLEDLQRGYEQLERGEAVAFGAKTSSYQQWATQLLKEAESAETKKEAAYWLAHGESRRLPRDYESGENSVASTSSVQVSLSAAETKALLQEVPGVYHTQINDALLTAVGIALTEWTEGDAVVVELEGHGREEVGGGVDVTRTVGWFTSIYPIELEIASDGHIGERLKAVKEVLRGVPRRGLGYGLLRYLSSDAEVQRELRERASAEVSFNYLGQFEYFGQGPAESTSTPDEWSAAPESSGMDQSAQCERTHLLEISGNVAGGRLQMVWSYSRSVHRRETINAVADRFVHALRELIAHCQSPEAGGYTPSDFPLATINQEQLDKLFATVESKS